MKKSIITFLSMILSTVGMLLAQDEYRISQPLPDSVNYSITIPSGWQVKLSHADHASITIVTPCKIFYDEANEPQVCSVEGRELTILENTSMPKSTILEIAVMWPISHLRVNKNALVTTEKLTFAPNCCIDIEQYSVVNGTVWKGLGNMELNVFYDGCLKLDTLVVADKLEMYRAAGSTFECGTIDAASGTLKLDRRSLGTDYVFHTPKNMTVKTVNRNWRRYFDRMELSFGFQLPITIYTNSKYGSAYNYDQRYAMNMLMSFPSFNLAKRLTFRPGLMYEYNWSHLENNVTTDGNSLTVVTPSSGLLPRQTLTNTLLGVDLGFSYGIGKHIDGNKMYANFGLSFARSIGGSLNTRTLGANNRWFKTNDDVDVFNPWQLRARMGLSMGSIGGRINLYYDLLPTYRSGIGADDIHCFGITVGF